MELFFSVPRTTALIFIKKFNKNGEENAGRRVKVFTRKWEAVAVRIKILFMQTSRLNDNAIFG